MYCKISAKTVENSVESVENPDYIIAGNIFGNILYAFCMHTGQILTLCYRTFTLA